MNFGELIGAVRDAWAFAWPPLVLCGVTYLVARFFNNSATHAALQQIGESARAYGAKLESFRSVLEPYGLNKLVPVVSLILVVWFMYVLNGPVKAAASSLPPHLSFQPDELIRPGVSEEELTLLVRKYPTATHFNDLYYLASAESEPQSLRGPADNWFQMQNVLKFAVMVSAVMILVNIKLGMAVSAQLGKFALMLILIGSLWLIALVGLLYEVEQEFRREWYEIRLQLQEDASDSLLEPPSDTEQQKIDRIRMENNRRWWRLYLIDHDRLDWIRYTFLDPSTVFDD